MNYRNFSTGNWIDDTMLSMSPEQKLLFVYLHTSPFSTSCGIFRMQPKMMGFQLGFVSTPFENAVKGLAGAFPNHVAVDWETMEVALLKYPGQLLITATTRAMNAVAKDISLVQSIPLLKALIAQNSPSVTAAYRSRLNSLLMQRVNGNRAQTDAIITAVPDEEFSQIAPIQEGDQEPAPAYGIIENPGQEAEPAAIILPTTWQEAAEHYIKIIDAEPHRLLSNLLSGPKELPTKWREAVKGRARYSWGNGDRYSLTIPSDAGARWQKESQMLVKIAQWIESPYNKDDKGQAEKAQVATGIRLSEYKPKK